MTQEEKAKAYDEAIKIARSKIKNDKDHVLYEEDITDIFPELKESEEERMIKRITLLVNGLTDEHFIRCGASFDEIKAWLEKQVEQKPNFCHHEVDLSDCSEEYRKAYYDGWNNCNMQHSQCKSELDDVVKCLINGMKFYYEDNEEATWGTDKWSMPVKHIIEVLEKQSEQKPTDKVEPKFKVGDKIKLAKEPKYPAREIIAIKNDAYYFDELVRLPLRYQDNWELVEEPKKCMFTKEEFTEEDRKILCEDCEEECKYSKSDDFTKALAECIHQAQRSVADPMVLAETWKDELIKLAKSEEPVSEELEKAAVEAFKQIVDENRNSFLEIFKAGAQWMHKKMIHEFNLKEE